MRTRMYWLISFMFILIIGQCDAFDNIITYLGTSRTQPTCYTKYAPWNSRDKGVIEFSFITSNTDGLLLHVGDSDKTNWTRNYLQLRVKHGMLNLISRVKNGSNVIKWKRIWFTREVDDLRWHHVKLRRDRIYAYIELDKEKKQVQFGVQGMAPVNLKGVIYVGGLPERRSNCGASSRTDQFVGAIKNLEYGTVPESAMFGKILDKKGIVLGYQDHCKSTRTRYYICQNGGICVNKFNDYRCNCLGTGYEGRTCQIASTSIRLKGLDYLEWKPLRYQHSVQSNNIAVRFKTVEPDGVLFYVGNSTKYLTVELYKGQLIVGISLNNERITINASAKVLNDDQWHLVEVSRREMSIKVIINKTHIIQQNIPGRHSSRILDDKYVCVGGKNYLEWLAGTLSKQYFMGCLQQVYYNGGNIVNSLLPSHKHQGRRYGNIVFKCLPRATKAPFTRMIRSKRYRPTPPRNTIHRARNSKYKPQPSPATQKKIDSKSKTFLIVGITVGSIVLLIIIAATIHYLRNRYKKEMVLTAVYTKETKPNEPSSATTSVFISPSSSGGTSSNKSNYFNK